MKIIEIEIEKITPYENNAKLHDEVQIKNVAESIKKYGFQQPLVLDKDNVIIVGHCRYEASKLLGLKKVPCVIADNLTEQQVKEFRLIDNKTNESAWDLEKLQLELPELDLSAFEIDWGGESNLDFETTPVDDEDYQESLVNKKLLKCPVCGHINEEKAFKNVVEGIEDEDTD